MVLPVLKYDETRHNLIIVHIVQRKEKKYKTNTDLMPRANVIKISNLCS